MSLRGAKRRGNLLVQFIKPQCIANIVPGDSHVGALPLLGMTCFFDTLYTGTKVSRFSKQ